MIYRTILLIITGKAAEVNSYQGGFSCKVDVSFTCMSETISICASWSENKLMFFRKITDNFSGITDIEEEKQWEIKRNYLRDKRT